MRTARFNGDARKDNVNNRSLPRSAPCCAAPTPLPLRKEVLPMTSAGLHDPIAASTRHGMRVFQ
jgi:hypothetical protein